VGSVVVHWSGSCPKRAARDALVEHLLAIAELSHSYFGEPLAISVFDHHVDGAIVVHESVAAGCAAAVPIVDDDDPGPSAGIELRPAGPLNHDIAIRGPLLSIPAVDLHGIAFRLYDGRGLYPDEDILSFVFATLPGDSAPYCRMVEVLPDDQRCRANQVAVRDAASCLLGPSIHLRYYCEQWTNLLLGSVKYFFVPDLQWRAYEDCPGYSDLKALLQSRSDDPRLADHAFAALLEGLRDEVESSADEAAQIKSFWDDVKALDN
jgi:hypothetical protein